LRRCKKKTELVHVVGFVWFLLSLHTNVYTGANELVYQLLMFEGGKSLLFHLAQWHPKIEMGGSRLNGWVVGGVFEAPWDTNYYVTPSEILASDFLCETESANFNGSIQQSIPSPGKHLSTDFISLKSSLQTWFWFLALMLSLLSVFTLGTVHIRDKQWFIFEKYYMQNLLWKVCKYFVLYILKLI